LVLGKPLSVFGVISKFFKFAIRVVERWYALVVRGLFDLVLVRHWVSYQLKAHDHQDDKKHCPHENSVS
jgi:hypothetical protein